ncbi:MAG: UPF0280 family protein [Xanthobacteraceae bacterium]|nr:UPF0280 family protein [Xanthobacteraceae bacterium]
MRRPPQARMLPDGRRLHLQDGPIDLVIAAFGATSNVRAAYEAAIARFTGLLDELCEELVELRRPADPDATVLHGTVALRMHGAVAPHAADTFITPMAAVAGTVAETVLAAMTQAAALDRAYVNNGGDIALHLAPGARFVVGLADHPAPGQHGGRVLAGTAEIVSGQGVGGIATSGRHGRSFSLGIADAVTVLAASAAGADAAATVIANAVDLPGHPAVARLPAREIQPDSDLGDRLVTRDVAPLSPRDVAMALAPGEAMAARLLARGLIAGAALRLQGETRLIGVAATDHAPLLPVAGGESEFVQIIRNAHTMQQKSPAHA